MSETNMELQAILDQALAMGKEYLQKGQAIAEEQLDIPENEEDREKMLDGMKKGAIASAVLVGLLGTRGGRKLTGVALKIGSIAALGTAAYKGYQYWIKEQGGDIENVHPVHDLDGDDLQQRASLLVSAMVSAANADGKIDDAEQQDIKQQILAMHLPSDTVDALEVIMSSPLNASQLAKKVQNQEEAGEVYLAVRLLIGTDSNDMERDYINDLVAALNLDHQFVTALEQELD